MKKKAFTLAEVLITLMVIGLLAMVTLPTLLQSFEKMMLKNQAKHALSVLSQALYESTSEGDTQCSYNGDIGTNTWTGCPTFFNDNFIKKFKLANKCAGTYTMNGCIPDYGLPETISGCSDFNLSYDKNAYILNNGIILIMCSKFKAPVFWVDVNGKKPPNKPLQDLLGFKIYKKSNGEYYFHDSIWGACLNFPIDNPAYFQHKSDLFK